ncbi:hypothetical protein TUBRATIS_28080 [Tubulinosema ratisbonensis]|uniref:Uncharacterized protein n=1 Tax=Tubulinosema ratisbonensis TaxID=291195 RepID=A0A437AI41_9MICR|nr:hypothetical protein TUBRATIS_28080 [Tubulinosema ratisbonensis]
MDLSDQHNQIIVINQETLPQERPKTIKEKTQGYFFRLTPKTPKQKTLLTFINPVFEDNFEEPTNDVVTPKKQEIKQDKLTDMIKNHVYKNETKFKLSTCLLNYTLQILFFSLIYSKTNGDLSLLYILFITNLFFTLIRNLSFKFDFLFTVNICNFLLFSFNIFLLIFFYVRYLSSFVFKTDYYKILIFGINFLSIIFYLPFTKKCHNLLIKGISGISLILFYFLFYVIFYYDCITLFCFFSMLFISLVNFITFLVYNKEIFWADGMYYSFLFSVHCDLINLSEYLKTKNIVN